MRRNVMAGLVVVAIATSLDALQTGTWPASYYGQEPALPGTVSTGGSDPGLWRYLQRAAVGWQVDERLLLEAGLFLADDLYFRSHVAGSGTEKDPYQPNSKKQDTVLLGVVGWF